MHLLLTHGFFLEEDLKEQEVLRPYPPLGILYLSSYLRSRGFDVDIYDSTFGSRQELFRILDEGPPAMLGIYGNLLTRGAVLAIIKRARLTGWTVVLGGPEPANYADQYLASGARYIVPGEGERVLEQLLSGTPLPMASSTATLRKWSSERRPRNRSKIWIIFLGRTADGSICIAISTPGPNVTEPVPFLSSPRAVARFPAAGAATRRSDRRTVGDRSNPSPTRWSGYWVAMNPTCCGTPTTYSRFTPVGRYASLRNSRPAGFACPLNALPEPTD